MVSLVIFSLLFGPQDLRLDQYESWETKARIWMTADEQALYQTLDTWEKEQFKGYFIARRQEHPHRWHATGNESPLFYIPRKYGDIRDALHYLFGAPKSIRKSPYRADLPGAWIYNHAEFEFQPAQKGTVRLAPTSTAAWEQAKQSLVKHPDLRYDFRRLTLGRNRLPTEIIWERGKVLGAWRMPQAEGTRWRVTLSIPQSFKSSFQATAVSKTQTMEMLVFLKKDAYQPRETLDPYLIRHDSRRIDLSEAQELTFETTLPAGRFLAEILVYSGFLPKGIKAETTVTALPAQIARIGDPIVCDQWEAAGILQKDTDHLLANNAYYRPTLTPPKSQSRVLVYSDHSDTQLFLHRSATPPQRLRSLGAANSWHVFECPPFGPKDRLLALGYPADSAQIAFSQNIPMAGSQTPGGPTLQANSPNDYLAMESLSFSPDSAWQLLSVNDTPLVGVKSGAFPWPALDWGQKATLRLEYPLGNHSTFSEYQVRRQQVFQEIQVRPKYLVAGTRNATGDASKVPMRIEVEGMPIPPEKQTPFRDLPKLWGIVVSDALLKSPAWHQIKESVGRWFRENTSEKDQFYVVHIATRPKLVLAPTANKALLSSTLKSLHSAVQLENYFTVRYLFEGLTQLAQHGSMPHQVLLLTHQLTEEVSQMETLLPILRESGLQLYNLEFPFEFQPESEERIANTEVDPILAMKVKEEDDQWRHGTLRDNLQEDRNVLAGWSFFFRTGKQKRDAKEDAIREEAFRRAFNQQLAHLTAGMTLQSGSGETTQSLFLFLEQLSAWQDHLVHMQLPLPLVSAEMIKVKPEEGHSVFWTLVDWQPSY